MPPRHHYWTIILEGKPTAFRAHLPDELLPTLRQLQVRHPDAVMKWFARGRLWDSQDQERADASAMRRPRPGARRPPSADRRPSDWRPGGEHRDPRDRFKVPRDEKRRRFAENLRRDRAHPPAQESGEKPAPPPAQGAGRRNPAAPWRPSPGERHRGSSGGRFGTRLPYDRAGSQSRGAPKPRGSGPESRGASPKTRDGGYKPGGGAPNSRGGSSKPGSGSKPWARSPRARSGGRNPGGGRRGGGGGGQGR